MLPAVEVERRLARRIWVSLPVEVEIGADTRLGRLTDLSRAGGRIDDFGGTKALGEALVIRRNGVALRAQIIWADISTAGLWFPEPLDERSFLRLRRLG